ncbi:nucleoside deaminase [Archangium lansingense]|uniref:Nucleoside deaminase n=1 Tax=Archangium lansingense TaxID=2995310 RepID=A0ABT4AM29_9BACT|nr:nucleoside deaminase [Archangium lansinium]MCY1082753.1 nucleoside deaminase [Archangium lansinium]
MSPPPSSSTVSAVDLRFTLKLPEWAAAELNLLPPVLPTLTERMAAVIRFSRLNFQSQTGGPFAAGVFERDTGRLVVIGVNRVMASGCSSAHAEIMALSLAQKRLGSYDLGGTGLPAHQLVVNWRPCAMCYGAVLWSGVRSLVIAGEGPELEQITGFDEGPVHPQWRDELARRGVEVHQDVLREEALAAYREFAASRQFVYNARLGK